MKTPFVWLTAALLAVAPLRAEFVLLWQLGLDDNTQSDFTQESGSPNEPPGIVSLPEEVDPDLANDPNYFFLGRDDDYYFAGDYPDSVGFVAEDEPWKAFERALVPSDPANRIHFILTPEQAAPTNRLRFTIDLFGLGAGAGVPSIHDIEVFLNGVQIHRQTDISAPITIVATASAGGVNAVAGENVLEIVRTGGTPSAAWIQFDYLMAEIDFDVCPSPLCEFTASATSLPPGGEVTLSWIASPDSTLVLNPGNVNLAPHSSEGIGQLKLTPETTTTYELVATRNGQEQRQSITVEVNHIISFESSRYSLSMNESATLFWQVDAGATVSIEPDIGTVTGELDETGNIRRGTVVVTPGNQERTYTLTAAKGDVTQTASVTIFHEPEWVILWQLGEDNGNQSEFVQESGPIAPPGSPRLLDNDYYFSGFYPDLFDDPVVYAAEPPETNFGRAVTTSSPSSRIHFYLTEPAPPPSSLIRVSVDFIWGGWYDVASNSGGTDFGVHDIEIYLNSVLIWSQAEITFDTLAQAEFTAGEVNLAAGENILEIIRVGGDSGGDPANPSWIQFDYLMAEINTNVGTPPPPSAPPTVSGVERNAATGAITLTWTSQPGEKFRVEATPDLGNWPQTPLVTGLVASGATTSYTHQPPAGATAFFYRIVREQ